MIEDAHYVPLPVGWVEYVENPLTENARVIRCPIGAAPAWVQRKHAGNDPLLPSL